MKKMLKQFCAVLGLGFGYVIWIRVTSLSIPCLFRTITGWKCPGCGITTLFLCLLKLDFRGAFEANPFLFVTGPALLAELIWYDYLKINGRKLPKWNERLILLYAAALLIFGVLRNIL